MCTKRKTAVVSNRSRILNENMYLNNGPTWQMRYFTTLLITLLASLCFSQESKVQPDRSVVEEWINGYFRSAGAGDAQQWAVYFSKDAIVEDPFGSKPIKTWEEILEKGENFVDAFTKVSFEPEWIYVKGYTSVIKWKMDGATEDNQRVTFEGVSRIEWTEGGKIKRLVGYW